MAPNNLDMYVFQKYQNASSYGLAAVTPLKYEYDLTNKAGSFVKSVISRTNKLKYWALA